MKIMDVMTSQAFDNFPEISENIKFLESLQPYLSQTFVENHSLDGATQKCRPTVANNNKLLCQMIALIEKEQII